MRMLRLQIRQTSEVTLTLGKSFFCIHCSLLMRSANPHTKRLFLFRCFYPAERRDKRRENQSHLRRVDSDLFPTIRRWRAGRCPSMDRFVRRVSFSDTFRIKQPQPTRTRSVSWNKRRRRRRLTSPAAASLSRPTRRLLLPVTRKWTHHQSCDFVPPPHTHTHTDLVLLSV